ncbi:MAG TPA: N-acetylglucosamine-6-phosphate deacetylase [Microcoleaceae cyanobacterium]|jgi:N-acetylglucosamine-6-phosphate deacetylase
MLDKLLIINAQIPGYQGRQQISIAEGIIQAVIPMSAPLPQDTSSTLDVAGDWLSWSGIDLQINGALGLAFPDLRPEYGDQLTTIAQFLWQQGVDGFLPTLVTTSIANIQRSLQTLAHLPSASSSQSPSAQILGVHLEGPFLNPEKRGAHPAEHLQPLTIDTVKRVLGDYASLVKVITLAPELDSTGDVIPYLRSLGITVSLGHSLATAAQANQAFEQGATMVTHAFNAMPGLHHREPGLLGAAIVHPQVSCGLIADGQHVDPIMMQLLLQASGYDDGIFLVSDALSPLGLPDGIYPWDERQIEVKQGTARLLNGTLSGTTLPLLVGVQNLVQWGICPPETAIALATTAPRRAIGLTMEYPGQPADLLRWHLNATKHLTWERLT